MQGRAGMTKMLLLQRLDPLLLFLCNKTMKRIVFLLGTLLLLFASEQAVNQVYVSFSQFDSLLRINILKMGGKMLKAEAGKEDFEAVVSLQKGHLLRFNVFPLQHCGLLPGKASETILDGFPVFILQTGHLSYLQLAHNLSSTCIQLTTDGEIADSLLLNLMRKSGLMQLKVLQPAWPEQVPTALRLNGSLLHAIASPSDLEGFTFEVRVTMLNDSVLHTSVQAMAKNYCHQTDFLETEEAVLIFRKGTIPDFLEQQPQNEPVIFSYYIRR